MDVIVPEMIKTEDQRAFHRQENQKPPFPPGFPSPCDAQNINILQNYIN